MSNLKKLLILESQLEELVKPKGIQNIGIVLPTQTKEEAFQEMISNGLADPSANIEDIEWITVIGVSSPHRDREGKIISQ